MSTPAAIPAVRESQFQRAVIELARRNGFRVFHVADSRKQIRGGRLVGDRQAAGFPDIVAVRERALYAELKGAKTRVTDEQVAWMQALLDAGEEVHLWRPGDWPTIERVLGRGAA